MTLEFRPPYQIDPNRSPEQDHLDRLNQALQNISQSSDQWDQNNRQSRMQDLQMQLLKQESDRKKAEDQRKMMESQSEWGTQAPFSATTPMSGPMTMDQSMRSVLDPGSPASPAPAGPSPDGGMVGKFRAWQQSRRAGPTSQPSGIPGPEVGYNEVLPTDPRFSPEQIRASGGSGMLTLGTKREESMLKKYPQPKPADSLEELLTDRVRKGEITLDQAFKMKASGSPSSEIKPSPGYRWDGKGGMEAIPGGPAFVKNQATDQKEKATQDSQIQEAQLVINKIDSALQKVGYGTAGVGSVLRNVPGTSASDLSADLDTILSSLGLGKLMEMKNNSKAGASGMGQLSDREMTLLTSALSSLKQSQSPGQLAQHLNDVKTHYQNILKMGQGVNPFDQGGAGGGAQSSGQPQTVQRKGRDGQTYTYTLNPRTGKYE
jgi:hypothetical protein